MNLIDRLKNRYTTESNPAIVSNQAFNLNPEFSRVHPELSEFFIEQSIDQCNDIQTLFVDSYKASPHNSRLICHKFTLWGKFLSKLFLHKKSTIDFYISRKSLIELAGVCGYEIVSSSKEQIFSSNIIFLSAIMNKYFVRFFPFSFFSQNEIFIFKKKTVVRSDVFVSVIVPARSEAGNIERLINEVPIMGKGTEIIFVEGGSTDNTREVIENHISNCTRLSCKLLIQKGRGKADAVWTGFDEASGSLLMILDADLSVSPATLDKFYAAWKSGAGDFINGSRLIYPMQSNAMKLFNYFGNIFFSKAFSFALQQHVTDTACGTKVLTKYDYERIKLLRGYFGHFDRFGDWDLLFGASKLNLKITDLPVIYLDRMYGQSKMETWKIGTLLTAMLVVGVRKLRFY
jgi:hypothetical protein